MLIPYYKIPISFLKTCRIQAFQKVLDGSSGFLGPCRFQHLQPVHFRFFYISLNHMFKTVRDCSWIVWSNLVFQKSKRIGCGSHGLVHQVRKPYRIVRVFPKWNREVTNPKWSRIIRWSFRAGKSFLNIYSKHGATRLPQTPNPYVSLISLAFL